MTHGDVFTFILCCVAVCFIVADVSGIIRSIIRRKF